MKKRIVSFLLLFLMAAGTVSCAKPGNSSDTTTPSESGTAAPVNTEDETSADALPVKNYGGDDYIILVNGRSDDYKSREFSAYEPNGVTINDAVYTRNMRISDKYGINLINKSMSGEADVLKNDAASGDATYDLALLKLESSGPLGIDGYLADLNKMPYLKLDGPWWDVNSVKDLSLGGKLFMSVGDMNICDKDMTWCLFFDKQIATDKNLPDFFKLASDKKWTFEKFQELCKDVSADDNGDGIMDGNDTWGHVTVFARSTIAYMYSMGTYYIVKDSTDLPVLKLDETVTNAFDKIINFFSSDNMCLDVQALDKGDFANQWRRSEAMFMNNQVLFYAEAMQNAERFRNSENDFGILPLPSSEEGEYGRHMVWREAYITVVPQAITAFADRYDRTALLLEAIQRESTDTVLTAYYEVALKSRFARDAQSSVMIDIIFANRYYDIASYYGWGNVSSAIQDLGKGLSTKFSSSIKIIEKSTSKDITKSITAFLEKN